MVSRRTPGAPCRYGHGAAGVRVAPGGWCKVATAGGRRRIASMDANTVTLNGLDGTMITIDPAR